MENNTNFEKTAVSWNPQRKISEEIVFGKIEEYMNAMKQARTGIPNNEEVKILTEESKIIYQVKAITYIISALQGILDICKPSIMSDCYEKWKRMNPVYRKQFPFEKEDIKRNGYNLIKQEIFPTIQKINVLLRTRRIQLIKRKNVKENELTLVFFELLEEFDSLFEKIYVLLIRHNIVSAWKPLSELTYLEKERKAIERIKGA